MLQFLPALMKGMQGAGGAAQGGAGGGIMGRFGQALGAQNMGKGSEKIGMQYANMGLQAPQLPDPLSQVNAMGQQPQRGQLPTTQMNPLLQMLMSGGR